MPMRPVRSLLFSPGSRPDMMQKAARSGADSLIFDLEDAVAEQTKKEARGHVAEAIARHGNPPVFVRVNHPSTGETEADLDAVVSDTLYGVILPKAEQPSEIEFVDDILTRLERERGLSPGHIVLLPLVESCLGLRFCYELATAVPRVGSLAFSSGEDGDFMVDLGGRWTPQGQAFHYPRSKLVCDTRAAGLEYPIDGIFGNLTDDDALRTECELARTLGYTGKLAIHPKQIETIHSVFTPSDGEVRYAKTILAVFAQAEAAGRGAIQHEGTMIDYANVKRAQGVLKLAGAIDKASEPA